MLTPAELDAESARRIVQFAEARAVYHSYPCDKPAAVRKLLLLALQLVPSAPCQFTEQGEADRLAMLAKVGNNAT